MSASNVKLNHTSSMPHNFSENAHQVGSMSIESLVPKRPKSPPLVINPVPRRPTIQHSGPSFSRTSSSPVVLLHEIKRLLLDPRQPHQLVCSRILRKNMLILSDILALVDNDINGTPITPIIPKLARRRRDLLESVTGKLQHILDSMQYYRNILKPTSISRLWRRVYAQSSDLDIAVEMMNQMVVESTKVCRGGLNLAANELGLDATKQPTRLRNQAQAPTSSSNPSISSPLSATPISHSTFFGGFVCETPQSMEAPWSPSPRSADSSSLQSPTWPTSGGTFNPASLLGSDKIIAVMGPTGAGKSTLINCALGTSFALVSDSLESCTQSVQAFRCHHPNGSGQSIVFVDTPGFDDTYRSDSDILTSIADWLNSTYQRGINLSGILYLHRLSDNRFAGTPLRNLSIFNKLCGSDALKNVVLVTTMSEDLEESVRQSRMSQLQDEYWRDMIASGSRVIPFDKQRETVWDLIDSLGVNDRQPVPLQLPREMVDQGKSLFETSAGKVLFGWLEAFIKQINEMIKRLESQILRSRIRKLREASRSGASQSSLVLVTEKAQLETQLRDVSSQMYKLRASRGWRLTTKIREKVEVYRRRTLKVRAITSPPYLEGPPSVLDSGLTPERKTAVLGGLEASLRHMAHLELADPFSHIRESLQTTRDILDIIKNSEVSSHTIIRLLQDVTTVFDAVMEKRRLQGLNDIHILDILSHLQTELAKTRELIKRVADLNHCVSMSLDDYRVLLICQKTVKDAYDALQIDCSLRSFASTLTTKSA